MQSSVDLNDSPEQLSTASSLGTYEYVILHGKRDFKIIIN